MPIDRDDITVCHRSLEDIVGRVQSEPTSCDATAAGGGRASVTGTGFGPDPRYLPPPSAGAGAVMRSRCREKVFGPGRAVPLDRNAKARIAAYSRAWDRLHRQPGQRGGALGRATLDVLGALLWVFHNARSGVCFPSYETIAGKAGCARSTVAEAIKALEFAGVSRGRTASCGSASAAATCSAVSAGAGGSSVPPTPTC